MNLYIHAVKLQMTASQMQAQQVQVGINQELNQRPSVLYLFTVESKTSRILKFLHHPRLNFIFLNLLSAKHVTQTNRD